jgi:hypothetical protein
MNDGIVQEVVVQITKHNPVSTRYASVADFQAIFEKEMNSLYLLSFLLTADHEKAEQCFVGGLNDVIEGNPVFKDWAQGWAERMIIQNALRVVNPQRNKSSEAPRTTFVNQEGTPLAAAQQAIAAILGLQPFDRFVYVMTVLAHYSDQNCCVLLGCTVRDVLAARIRALQQVGNAMAAHHGATTDPHPEKLTLRQLGGSAVGWLVIPNLATSA